ncbi:MAG: ABC transporter substrate-binding protein [Rhodospirillales bacterium]|nr:ABC transporter substrate-binding protein [Rhodospirillales bacterium]
MTKKILHAALMAAALAALPVGSPPAHAIEKPEKDTLVVATMWECLPFSMEARRSRFFNESEILDTLVKLDYGMNLVPGLATAWKRQSPTEWTFTLRQGVTFHDGQPLDAEAVKFSLERVTALLPYAGSLLDLAEISVTAPDTLNIRTKQPFAALPNQLTDAITGIYARSAFDAEGKFVKPVGTGPFRYASYTKQDRTVVERFDGYWGKAPSLKRVVYRYVPDHSARVLSLETGEVDLAVDIPPADVKRLSAAGSGFQVYREPSAGLYYMVLNTAAGRPFADVRARRAVNAMIDRKAIVEHALDGVGKPAWQFFAPGFDWVPSELPAYALDPAAATSDLTAAGFRKEGGAWMKDGKPLAVEILSYSSRTEMPLITEAVSGLLKAAGLQTSTKMFTWPGMLSLVQKGQYDAYVVFWTPEMTAHPDLHLLPHFHSASGLDYNGYRNAQLDDLLIRGRGLDAGPERQATYAKALTLVHEDAPIVPLVHKIYAAATNTAVKGFRIHPSGFFYDFKSVRKD